MFVVISWGWRYGYLLSCAKKNNIYVHYKNTYLLAVRDMDRDM
jgi:hypothetical protein